MFDESEIDKYLPLFAKLLFNLCICAKTMFEFNLSTKDQSEIVSFKENPYDQVSFRNMANIYTNFNKHL